MTKKEMCLAHKPFAYFSGVGGVELHYIEYGCEDYIYCTSNAWHGKTRYHKCKVFTAPDGGQYIRVHGYYVPLNECIKM